MEATKMLLLLKAQFGFVGAISCLKKLLSCEYYFKKLQLWLWLWL